MERAEQPQSADAPDAIVTKKLPSKPQRPKRTPTDRPAERWSFENRITRNGEGLGSTEYMAPEQWDRAQTATPASDIYALAVIAYEALTGHVPFRGNDDDDHHPRYSRDEAPELGAGFSPEVDRVLRHGLSISPLDRYRTALEFVAELRAALRTGERAQLLSAAQHWQSKGCAPGLLWGGDVLADFKHLTSQAAAASLSKLECSFIANSHRRAHRLTWAKRTIASALVLATMGFGVLYAVHRAEVAEEHARAAQQLAEEQAQAARRTAEADHLRDVLEKGRSALLHHEPGAEEDLAEAFRLAPTWSTGFMLSKAVQPGLVEQARLPATKGGTWSAAFSPDGAQLVTSDGASAQVWDVASHRRLLLLAHADVVYQAIYSADGTQIVTACGDGAVRVWSSETGALIRELRRDLVTRYFAVVMAPDGRFIAAIDLKGRVADVWFRDANDWNTSRVDPFVSLANDASEFPSIALSVDGQRLATSGGNDVRVFSTRAWSRELTIRDPQVYGLAWDPSGRRLLTGTSKGKVTLWDVPSGRVGLQLDRFALAVDAVAFSPDGHWVATASRDGTERIWDAASGQLHGHENYLHSKIVSIEFDHTSTRIVAGGVNGAVAIANTWLGMPLAVLEGARKPVMAVHFDPSSSRVVGAISDRTARIWDATAPFFRWGSPPIEDNCDLVTSLEPDKRFLAVGCHAHATEIWDTKLGRLLAKLPSVTPAGGEFSSAHPAVSDLGDRAAIARGPVVEVYEVPEAKADEVPEAKLVHTIVHGAAVNAVAFSSTGDVVSGDVLGHVFVKRGNGAQLALPPLRGATPAGIDAVGFLPDGHIITVDAKQHLRIYDPLGKQVADLKTDARVRTLRMSVDGRRLITVPMITGRSDPAELWDVEQDRIIAQLGGQKEQGETYSARFIEGGQILTSGDDGAVRLWDSATGAWLRTYQGPPRFIAETMRSGSMIIAGNADGSLLFWDFLSGNQLWTMPAHRAPLIGLRVDGNEIVTRSSSGDISRWTLPDPEIVLRTWQARNRAIVSR